MFIDYEEDTGPSSGELAKRLKTLFHLEYLGHALSCVLLLCGVFCGVVWLVCDAHPQGVALRRWDPPPRGGRSSQNHSPFQASFWP